jgi:hypothetical protein
MLLDNSDGSNGDDDRQAHLIDTSSTTNTHAIEDKTCREKHLDYIRSFIQDYLDCSVLPRSRALSLDETEAGLRENANRKRNSVEAFQGENDALATTGTTISEEFQKRARSTCITNSTISAQDTGTNTAGGGDFSFGFSFFE